MKINIQALLSKINSWRQNSIRIGISGVPGVGKSTFVENLRQVISRNYPGLRFTVVQEPVDQWMAMKDTNGKNLLEHFYSDQVKYSFPFQMNSFISRVNSIYNALVIDSGNTENPPDQERDTLTVHEYDIVFVERSVFTDKYCFADMCHKSGKMNDIEYNIYNNWHSWLVRTFNLYADGYIYLKTNPNVSHERIVKRLRSGEEAIPIEYLAELHDKHNEWLEKEQNVLTFDFTPDYTNQDSIVPIVDEILMRFELI